MIPLGERHRCTSLSPVDMSNSSACSSTRERSCGLIVALGECGRQNEASGTHSDSSRGRNRPTVHTSMDTHLTDKQVHQSISTTAAPAERVIGLDVARALAVLGMVVVHFALVMGKADGGPDWLKLALSLLDGRAAATFLIIAGIGVSFMSRRAVLAADSVGIARVQRVLIARGVFLLAAGFINLLIWPGDILRVYGVSLLLAASLITATDRWLLLAVFGSVAGFLLMFVWLDFESNWDWATLTYQHLWSPAGLIRNLFYDGFRSVFPWTGFLVFGMWLGRMNLCDLVVNRNVILTALGTALAVEAISSGCVSYSVAHSRGMDAATVKALFGTESMPPLPFFLLASGGEATALIACCVRLTGNRPSLAWQPLSATGQMSFTWYVAHIILGLGTVEALDQAGSLSLPVAAGCGIGFFLIAVLLSWVWKQACRQGPIEWFMRKITG